MVEMLQSTVVAQGPLQIQRLVCAVRPLSLVFACSLNACDYSVMFVKRPPCLLHPPLS